MEEYSEFLYEMASVRAYKLDSQILLAVNPDIHRQGLAYFKMYNSNSVDTATKVWRINFLKPEFVKAHKGKIPASTEINNEYRNKLISYLTATSKENKKYSVWDVLKYHWNDEMGFCNEYDLDDYMAGKADNNTNPAYLKSTLGMPNYKNL